MNRTIRGRIALWAFAVFLVLLGLQSLLVLRGLDRALHEVADRDLLAKLDSVSREVADVGLRELRVRADAPRAHLGDLVFEIRDHLADMPREGPGAEYLFLVRREGGHVIARSRGLAEAVLPESAEEELRDGLSFRDAADPRAFAAGQKLRVAALRLGPYKIELARSLAPFRAIQRATRTQLLAILAGVSMFGALGAYTIARRALAPVRRLADEARRLQTLSEGDLPRSGRRDEIDDLAAVLNQLLGRVRADVLRVRQFTADAAHEIRTPLAALRGHLELLLARRPDDDAATLVGLLEEIDRLARLVDQLLLLEKLEALPDARRDLPLDLGALAGELVEHLAVVGEERGVRLVAEVELAPVRGDPEKLRQLFLNLIDNAFRYTPAGGQVTVRVGKTAANAEAAVEDTGPGIPAEELPRVFQRFASDRRRPGAGTGLGLAIAQAIARAHGGDLSADSPVAAQVSETPGARFTLRLPLADTRREPLPAATAPAPEGAAGPAAATSRTRSAV